MRYSGTKRLLGGRKKVRKANGKKKRSQKLVSEKISVLRHEGKPEKQAVAMAINMGRAGRLRPGGVYVRKNA